MKGINASVVGLLGAVLFDPVFTTAVRTHADFGIALGCFILLVSLRLPPLSWSASVLRPAGSPGRSPGRSAGR